MRFARFLAGAVLMLAPAAAWAQGACPMGQSQPQIIPATVTSYTLSTINECNFLVFTSQTPVVVTAPASTVLPPSFVVTLESTLAPVSIVVPSGQTLNNQSAYLSQSAPPYTNLQLAYDGTTNYYLTLAGNYGVQNLAYNLNSSQLMPGTTVNNSPTSLLPGIGKWIEPSAWVKNNGPVQLNSSLCKGAPPDALQQPSLWLLFYDYLGLPRYVPTC